LFARYLVLSIAVLVAVQYSNLAQWYASYREPPRSTIVIASIQTAIEYEYRFTEYRFTEYRFTEYRFTEYRFTEYEHDKIRCEARTATWVHCIGTPVKNIELLGVLIHIGPVPCARKESLGEQYTK
jgi:hypothetical protein